MGKYFNMNELAIGTQLKVKKTGEVGTLKEIFNYPTSFKVEFENGNFEIFKTRDIEILESTES